MRKIDKNKSRNIIIKWDPIIKKLLDIKNKSLTDLMCLYCEWFGSDEEFNKSIPSDQVPLRDKIIEISQKSNSYHRTEIVGKFYNKLTGIIEYKLSTGEFITMKDEEFKLSYKEKIDLFGIEFIRDLDPQEFRDKQIDAIL